MSLGAAAPVALVGRVLAGAPASLASRALASALLPFKANPSSSSPRDRIPYGTAKSQFGELRVPRGAGPHPVAVVVHGGFWKAAYGLDLMDRLSSAITAAGVATRNIEYRRVGEEGGGWPRTFRDASGATNHLRALAKTHPLDLTRVGGHFEIIDPKAEAGKRAVAAVVALLRP